MYGFMEMVVSMTIAMPVRGTSFLASSFLSPALPGSMEATSRSFVPSNGVSTFKIGMR